MSRFKKNVGRRILAYLLSGAMIMSNMTAFASEPSNDTGGGYYEEIADVESTDTEIVEETEADEIVKDEDKDADEHDDGKESSEEAVKETEVKDSEQTTETQTSDEEQASETRSSLRTEKKEIATEEAVLDVDNKDALENGVEVSFISKGSSTAPYELSNFTDLIFEGFGTEIKNDHGPQSAQENASITFTVPGTAEDTINVEVGLCGYSNGTVEAKVGDTPLENITSESKTNAKDGESKPALVYTIAGVTGGTTVTVIIKESGKYVHYIKASLDVTNKPALESGVEITFTNRHNPKTDLSTFENLTFAGFGTEISNDHGPQSAQANATITFKVPGTEDDTVNIEVGLCTYGGGTVEAEIGGTPLENITSESKENTKDGTGKEALVYTIPGVAGGSIVTVKIKENGKYVHSIKATIQPKGTARTITLADESGIANGSATAGDVKTAISTTTVNLEKVATVTANEGYRLTGWEVTYEEDSTTKNATVTKKAGKYSFTMPDANVTVKPIFSAIGTFSTTKFYEEFTNKKHDKSDPVDDINGLTVIKGIIYNDNSHGLGVGNGGQMTLYLESGKKYEITVVGCSSQYSVGEKTTMTAATGETPLTVITEPKKEYDPNGRGETPPQFTILGAEGEVTLTFGGGYSYVHSIAVQEDEGTRHVITVEAGDNGKVSVRDRVVTQGDQVTLTVEPDPGYRLQKWEVTEPQNLEISDNKFTMPANDVKVKAIFEAEGTEHSLTLVETAEHGSATAVDNAATTALSGTIVELDKVATATAEEGYELNTWQVTYEKADGTEGTVDVIKNKGKYSFTMPDADVTITPVFQEIVVKYFKTTYFNKQFTDEEHKTGDAVDDVDGLEILEGTSKFKYHGNQHGLDIGTANIKLTLNPEKVYDITIWGCQHTKDGAKIDATFGGKTVHLETFTGSGNPEDSQQTSETNVKKYTIFEVQNEITLAFFGDQSYVHSIILTENSGKEKHRITITDNGHGSAAADNVLVEEGTEITLTAKPDNHYQFKEWQVISGGDVKIEDDKFIMPDSDVEIKAIFEPITRRDWDFVNDENLKGENGEEVTGTTKTVAGLSINVTAEGSGWDSTGTGTDGAVAKNKTIITIPVEGTTCNVKVSAENASYTVDGNAAERAEQTFECDSTDGKVVIAMTADNHIKAINVTPVYLVKAGTYNFTSSQKDLQIDGFTFNGFEHKSNSHGCEAENTGASITLNLSGKANINILGCRYGAGTGVDVTASSGTVIKKTNTAEGADAAEFDIKKTNDGEVTLTFESYGTLWIHSISVEYIPEYGPDVYTAGIDVWDFGAEQLQSTDTVTYNNMLTEDMINSWYANVTPGTSGVSISSFEVKDEAGKVDFMFNDGGYTGDKGHRLRTANTKLTRYDEKTLKIDDTTYQGYLYSNKESDKGVYIGVKLNAGDIMTAVVSSNGKNYTVTVEDPEGGVQNFARTYSDSAKASLITYYATESGMHKIYNGTDEKLVVARVTRQHNKVVKVSGTVTRTSGVEGNLTLDITCRESGEVKNVAVAEDGSYTVDLFEHCHYDVVVKPTIYVIAEGATLELGAANETQTYTHNITVKAVTLRKVSGSIIGLDDAAMARVNISFEKPEDKIYLPTMEIDRRAKTYTALLESGVEYVMVTEGINDYELDNRANNNSDRIRLVSDAAGRNITYVKKPVYKVTINPVGATLDDLANATFTFTNLNEEGYVYDFTGANDIALRDGTYSVVVLNSGAFRQKLTSNFVVDGSDVTKTIAFDNTPITKWDFVNKDNYDEKDFVLNPCDGLSYNGDGQWKYHGTQYGSSLSNIVISVPVFGSGKVAVGVGYTWDISSGSVTDSATSNGGAKTIEIPYDNTDNKVEITVGTSTTTYIKTIEVIESFEYKATLEVGKDKDYQTINDALEAVRKMDRTADQAVTIMIDPGNYEEMLVIDTKNIKLANAAGANASIGLRNKGVDIDANAVRITSYYGHGYSYYSMGNDCKWNAEVLEANKANGYESYTNPGSGTTNGSYWNATVVINASNVSAEGIIFENSFNQYISKKAAEDVIVKTSSAKEGAVPRASMAYGDTTVQQKKYVERAAALAIANGQSILFDNCKFIGRQDTLYGSEGVTAAFYGCSVYGGTDYIFGGMKAVFAKCDLVFNTSDDDSSDLGYITAAQQKSGRGYLMYNCHVTSTMPGVDTASKYTSKPGYLGRPWQAHTGEAVFYMTIIDEADARWENGPSLIIPVGWSDSLSGVSELSQEYGTYELADVNNSSKRVDWAKVLTEEKLVSGEALSVETFLGSWDAFAGKDMTIVLPNDANAPAPAQPKAIINPETEKADEVIKGGTIVLSAEMGAKIYYNVNADSDPTETSELLYKGEINVTDENIKDDTITIKAIAVKYGKTSELATFTYKVVEAPTPDKPVLTPDTNANVLLGSSVKMSAPYGAKIYYNINTETAPTEQDTLYTGKLGVKLTLDMVNKEDSTVKIQAIAVMNGKTSEVTTAVYNVTVNKPVANFRNGYQFPDGGGKVKLTADEDVTILYTMGATADATADPTLPESNPMTYDKSGSGITVTQDTTIKAVAKRGSKYSAVVTLEYLVPLSMPVATPESGSVLPKNRRIVRLTADEGTTIYYTVGADSDPTTESDARKTYDPAQGIEINEDNTTIKAVAVKDERQSLVVTFTYTISDEEFPVADTPTVTTVNGNPVTENTVTVEAGTDVVVKLATATEGAAIHYTTDNKVPTASSNLYNTETGITIPAIAEETVIMAIAVKENYLESEPLTFTIQVKPQGGDLPDPDPDPEPTPGITVDDKAGIEIVGLESEYGYTGAAITPDFDVVDNGIKENGKPRELILGTDYTVKYTNNKKEGATATVTVVGKGNYSGKEVEGSFEIKSISVVDESKLIVLTGAKITKIAPQLYNGTAQHPDFELTPKGGDAVTYKYDADKKQYLKADGSAEVNVAISGNRNKGTATILVTGAMDAKGKATSVKATFKITPADISTAEVKVAEKAPYAVNGATPAVTVSYTFEGATEATILKAGRDYTVKYSNNKKGNATGKVVVAGTGNFTKKAPEGNFTVENLDMKNTSLVAADAYDGVKAAKIKAVVVDANGDALKASQYTIKVYSDQACETEYTGDEKGKCTTGDTIYVRATAKDTKNLVEDSTTEPLEVKVGANIAKAKIQLNVKSKAYTGTYVKLKEDDLKVTMKVGKETETLTLKPENPVEGAKYDYEIISYSNNINKGTATAVIKGIGDYSGTKTIKFKIAAKEMKKMTIPTN